MAGSDSKNIPSYLIQRNYDLSKSISMNIEYINGVGYAYYLWDSNNILVDSNIGYRTQNEAYHNAKKSAVSLGYTDDFDSEYLDLL